VRKKSIDDLTQQEAMDIAVAKCFEQSKQKPAEWSEEDKSAINVLKNIIKKSEIIDSIIYTNSLKEELYNWLKSLRPQNRWKPSEEQIVALKHASNDCSIAFADMKILATLYEQLKALHHYEQDT
jgi:hypothetical protein